MRNLLLIILLGLFVHCKPEREPEDLLPLSDSVLTLMTSDPSSLVISKQRPVSAGAMARSQGDDEARLTGFTERSPELDVLISPLFSGRIEKMYVQAAGEYVKKGQVLFEYYSAEVNTLQDQLLLAIRQGAKEQAEKLTARLLFLRVPEDAIRKLKMGKAIHTLPFLAPASGYLFLAGVEAPGSDRNMAGVSDRSGSMGMSATEEKPAITPTSGPGQLPVAETYFVKGQALFAINNLSELWVRYFIPPSEAPARKGRIQLSTTSGTSLSAQISEVEPELRGESEFISVRAVLPNKSGNLRTGELVIINGGSLISDTAFAIPASAILDLGNKLIVWKLTRSDRSEGVYVYAANEVSATATGQGSWNIKSGLNPEDSIAPEAGFMTDVQSLIQVQP